jgi:hypothetical protein
LKRESGYHRRPFAMLDLKAKLAAAGLVTKEDIERAEKPGGGKGKRRGGRERAPGKGKGDGAGPRGSGVPRLAVASLRKDGKGEQYEAIRRFIEKARLYDPARPPTEHAQTFHFSTAKGQIGRLVLEPDVLAGLQDGSAGLVAYMSNHGLAHSVVPAAAARDLAELFPLWLRVLKDHPGAGRLEAELAAEAAAQEPAKSEAVASEPAAEAAASEAAASEAASEAAASEAAASEAAASEATASEAAPAPGAAAPGSPAEPGEGG